MVATNNPTFNAFLSNLQTYQSNVFETLSRGTLVSFQYKFFKTDSYPLVIVSNINQGAMIKGLNLHYLTFNYIRNVLQQWAGNPGFSWGSIKADNYLSNAYRCYKWNGIEWQNFKILDSKLIVKVANMVRSIDPFEVRAIKQSIREQVAQQMNVTADQLSTATNQINQNTESPS